MMCIICNKGNNESRPVCRDCFNKTVEEMATEQAMENQLSTPFSPINPAHYRNHPSGVECIKILRHFNYCKGAAMKYIWRAGEKDDEIQDLRKAIRYIEEEIGRIEKARQQL